MNYRPERVSQIIRDELSKLILRELEFEPGALVTLTYVDVDKKLSRAMVGVSVLSPSANFASGGPPKVTEEAFKVLQKTAGKLQWLLLKKINIKPMPQIIFELDLGLEHAAKIEKALLENAEN